MKNDKKLVCPKCKEKLPEWDADDIYTEMSDDGFFHIIYDVRCICGCHFELEEKYKRIMTKTIEK